MASTFRGISKSVHRCPAPTMRVPNRNLPGRVAYTKDRRLADAGRCALVTMSLVRYRSTITDAAGGPPTSTSTNECSCGSFEGGIFAVFCRKAL